MAVNLGITHLSLGALLQTELEVPVFVEHGARAAALWLSEQAVDGSAPGPASVAFLAIGTGISAGVVLDGAVLRLRRGAGWASCANGWAASTSRRATSSGVRSTRRLPPSWPNARSPSSAMTTGCCP
jgi:lipid-binding SYLF domain-containing protein